MHVTRYSITRHMMHVVMFVAPSMRLSKLSLNVVMLIIPYLLILVNPKP